MAWFSWSAMYSRPRAASTSTSMGAFNTAAVPTPSMKPALPLPAMVLVYPARAPREIHAPAERQPHSNSLPGMRPGRA
jgi:hypothetical protein